MRPRRVGYTASSLRTCANVYAHALPMRRLFLLACVLTAKKATSTNWPWYNPTFGPHAPHLLVANLALFRFDLVAGIKQVF